MKLQASGSSNTLLDRLIKLVGEQKGEPTDAAARARISDLVQWAGVSYDGERYWTSEDRRLGRPNLHEIADPLMKVASILDRESNWPLLLTAFGAPLPGEDSDASAIEAAVARLDAFRRDLQSIEQIIPKPPQPRGRGRQSGTGDLYRVVSLLADLWEQETGCEFKPLAYPNDAKERSSKSWDSGNRGTAFVVQAMTFIDAARHHQLREVMDRVRSDRLNSPKKPRRTTDSR